MALARTFSDGSPMPVPMQAVLAACARSEVDQLLARLASLVANYPPSGVVIERFVCQDHELRDRLIGTITAFVPPANGIPYRRVGDAMAVVEPVELAQMAAILVIDKIHSSVFRGSGYLSREITKSAVAMAYTMRAVAECQRANVGEAFLYGLINRLGVPVLYEYLPNPYATCIASLPGTTIQLVDAERGATGTDHVAVLSAICDHFGFPEWIRKAINPASLTNPLRKSAAFASAFVHQNGFDMGLANRPPEITEKLVSALGIFQEDVEEIRVQLLEGMAAFSKFAV